MPGSTSRLRGATASSKDPLSRREARPSPGLSSAQRSSSSTPPPMQEIRLRLEIPMVTWRDAREEWVVDIYSRLLADRIIFLGTPIDEEIANLVVAELLHLESEEPERDISIYVNSPGGSVYAGLTILDTMQFVK